MRAFATQRDGMNAQRLIEARSVVTGREEELFAAL